MPHRFKSLQFSQLEMERKFEAKRRKAAILELDFLDLLQVYIRKFLLWSMVFFLVLIREAKKSSSSSGPTTKGGGDH